jgi:hypothetical protein
MKVKKLLQKIEWIGFVRLPAFISRYEEGEIVKCCPLCGGICPDDNSLSSRKMLLPEFIGHKKGCEIGNYLKKKG